MYLFPHIRLPPRAIEAAKQVGKVLDVFYCLKLLEATDISTVLGSRFGQREGEEFRKSFKAANPDSNDVKRVGKEAGEKWKSLSDESYLEQEKKPYVDRAAELKVEYERVLGIQVLRDSSTTLH